MASPKSRPWWVLWSKVPVACPNTQGCFRMWTNHVVVCLMQVQARSTSPSSYSNPGTSSTPLYPSIVLEVGNAFWVPIFRNYTLVNLQVGSPRDLGVRHHYHCFSSFYFAFLYTTITFAPSFLPSISSPIAISSIASSCITTNKVKAWSSRQKMLQCKN